jgi:hypothetical protein
MLVPMLLLIAYLIGLIVLAAVLLGRRTVLDEGAIVLLLLLALSGGLIWLLGRYVARPGGPDRQRNPAPSLWHNDLGLSPDQALYARRIPGRSRDRLPALPRAGHLCAARPAPARPAPELLQPIPTNRRAKQLSREFLKATTTSFIVIRDDTIL